jgi:integrase
MRAYGSIQRIDRPKPWRARYRGPDGMEHSKSFRRKVDAQRCLREQEGRVDQGVWLDPGAGQVRLSEYAERWLSGRTLKPKTAEGYRSLLESRILPTFGAMPLGRIQRHDVRAWVAAMGEEGLSASRVWSAGTRRLGSSPRGRSLAGSGSSPRTRWSSSPMLVRGVRMALAASFGLSWSGLRWGEAVALRWENVDVENRRVRVSRSVTEVGGRLVVGEPKTHEHRTVIVPRFALPAGAGDGLVFTAPKGGYLRSANFRRTVWLPAVAECELGDLVVHDLRDTAASLAIASGCRLRRCRGCLGTPRRR